MLSILKQLKSTKVLFASSVICKNDIYSFMKYNYNIKYLDGVPNFYQQLFHFRYVLYSRPPEGADEIVFEMSGVIGQ